MEPKSIQEWSRRYAYAGNKKPPKDQPNENEITNSLIRFADWPASKTAYKTELITHLDDLMSTELNKDIKQIIVKIGDQPRAAQQDAELTIWVNPALGFAGRPSTEKILAEVYAHKG